MSSDPAGTVLPVPDDALANTSYLLVLGGGQAAVVDPRRDIETYQHLAAQRRLRLTAVLETHLHADFISGSRELTDAGVTVLAAAEANLAFPHTAVADGDQLPFAECTIEVLATPGHTPEHVSFLIQPPTGAGQLFTGGSLIFGGAARTDLSGPARTAELTRAQYASLRRIAQLPSDTRLFPTHGAGSFCSVGPALTGSGTLAGEFAANDLLTAPNSEVFAQLLHRRLGSFPPYFLTTRPINQAGPTSRNRLPPARPIPALEAATAQAAGAVIIDVRPLLEWSAGSPSGAISNMLRPAFASWLGWSTDRDTPLIWLTTSDEAAQGAEATALAQRIGHDGVLGWIDGGIDAWRDADLPVTTVELIDPASAARDAAAGALLIDVRQQAELSTGMLPGARHLELGDIIAGAVPPAQRVVTYCGHGERSATAASLLAARGLTVASLVGGVGAWTGAGRPLTPATG